MEIYYDSYNEGVWFKNLHPRLSGAVLYPFPAPAATPPQLGRVLGYDRPDIFLVDSGTPILVIERTIEVPSGHNVGQRFARLVAAAENRVPVVYFGPYSAYKHGGATAGPRYMNLRLFFALERMAEIEQTAVVTIRWPVDVSFEILQTPKKDERMRRFMALFFELYDKHGLEGINEPLMASQFEREQEAERQAFIQAEVVRPDEYEGPPPSVQIIPANRLPPGIKLTVEQRALTESVLYSVGMTYIRSDPYTGMAMLYAYLYCGGLAQRTRNLFLLFPNITTEEWSRTATRTPNAKHIRLYKIAADGILFADGYLTKEEL